MTETRTETAGRRIYGAWKNSEVGPQREGEPEDPTRCFESVWDETHPFANKQCLEQRGYGKGGKYCGLHAEDHPAED